MASHNTSDIIATNKLSILGIPVVGNTGVKRTEYFMIGKFIGQRGETTDLSSEDVPSLDSTNTTPVIVSEKTTWTFSGKFAPNDPVNELWTKLGFDKRRNVATKLMEVMWQDRFQKVENGEPVEGVFQAKVFDVLFTPKPPTANAGEILGIEVEMSQVGDPVFTYAELDLESGRWKPTMELRNPREFEVYEDMAGSIHLDRPVASVPAPPVPEGELE